MSTEISLFSNLNYIALNISDFRMAAEGGSSEGKKSRRLSGEPALHEDHFPPLTQFNPPDKLPSMASVIGRLRNLSGGGRSNMISHKAVLEVAKEV